MLQNGKKTRGKMVSLYCLTDKGDEDKEIYVGLIVSKRCAPKAVTRNHIRRLIYAFFREENGAWARGIKTVVKLEKDVRDETRKEISLIIRGDLTILSKKAGIVE